MLDQSDDPTQILNQFKAASMGFDKAQHLLLDEVFRKTLAIRIAEALETCPGNCGQEEKIAIIRNQFPELGLYELTDKMKEIQKISEILEKKHEPLKNVIYRIDNMVCQGCAEKISDILEAQDGVLSVSAKARKKLVTIQFDASQTGEEELATTLKDAGYPPQKTLQ